MKGGAAALAIGLVAFAGGAAAAVGQPDYREIKDWIVACDNGARCLAMSAPADEALADPDSALQIQRGPGPAGPLQVTLASAAEGPIPLLLDGKPIGPFAWSRPDEDGVRSLSGAEAQRFVATIREGSTVTAAGARLSLSGLKAALLVMDAAQGRVGNQSALARPGPAPAASTPQGPPLPVLRAARPAPPLARPKALIAAVRKSQADVLIDEGCEEDAKAEDDAQSLTRDEALVVVTCIMGAYQASSVVFRVPRDAPAKARRLELPLPPRLSVGAVEAKGVLTSAGFDPATATLSETAKGRGLADCGVSASWVFDGTDFRLASLNLKDRCGGRPGEWLPVWRSQLRPAG